MSSCFAAPLFIRGSTFGNLVSFKNTSFLKIVSFAGADFSGVATFEKANFLAKSNFSIGLFVHQVDFIGAIFSGAVNFQRRVFEGDVLFRRTIFSEAAGFEGTRFSRETDFGDAVFKGATKFGPLRGLAARHTQFEREPPRFFGATLHQDTDFTDVEWPRVPNDPDPENRRFRAIKHRRAYERLKLLMDSQKKVADELMFQRLELRCREVEATGDWRSREWWVARISRLYGALSDYGWDPVRPAVYLIYVWLAGWALIARADCWGYIVERWADPVPAEYVGFWRSGALSFSNLFGFLGLNRTFLWDEIRTLTTVSEVVSTVQTVFGLILLFLLGLALRNRFRIK